MSASPLPTSRAFVTKLFSSLSDSASTPATTTNGNSEFNVLKAISDRTKKQLLFLQVLYPNDFLPALDLLDRGLVTRFVIGNEHQDASILSTANKDDHLSTHDSCKSNEPLPENSNSPATIPSPHDTIHYVRSAQHRPSRFTTSYDTTTSYEVRLLAWTCSCPAFAFAAFPSMHPEPELADYNSDGALQLQAQRQTACSDTAEVEWAFGGISMDADMSPVCKHLLACVLAERCGSLFGGCVEVRDVSVDEAAGWSAGWGD